MKSNITHYDHLIIPVRERRESLCVNQEMLAKLSGVGLRTIKEFESGKGNPTLHTLLQITDALGLDICVQVKKPNL